MMMQVTGTEIVRIYWKANLVGGVSLSIGWSFPMALF